MGAAPYFFYKIQRLKMTKQKSKTENQTSMVQTPEGEFSRTALALLKNVQENKLDYLLLFSTLQRSHFAWLNIIGSEPHKENMELLDGDLYIIEQLIATA